MTGFEILAIKMGFFSKKTANEQVNFVKEHGSLYYQYDVKIEKISKVLLDSMGIILRMKKDPYNLYLNASYKG